MNEFKILYIFDNYFDYINVKLIGLLQTFGSINKSLTFLVIEIRYAKIVVILFQGIS